MNGGVLSDYILGKQQSAYVEIFLNTDFINRIKCIVQYRQFIRIVSVAPQSTIYSILQKAFSVRVLVTARKNNY